MNFPFANKKSLVTFGGKKFLIVNEVRGVQLSVSFEKNPPSLSAKENFFIVNEVRGVRLRISFEKNPSSLSAGENFF